MRGSLSENSVLELVPPDEDFCRHISAHRVGSGCPLATERDALLEGCPKAWFASGAPAEAERPATAGAGPFSQIWPYAAIWSKPSSNTLSDAFCRQRL